MQEGKESFQQQDYEGAMSKLLPAAKRGDPDAEYAVGYMFFYGKGVIENQAEGKEWISAAAKQGQPQAIKAMSLFKATAPMPRNTYPINSIDY